MYRRKANIWTENFSFRILDMLCLEVSFLIACFARHKSLSICLEPLYINANVMFLFFSFITGVFWPIHALVFERGYYKEFIVCCKSVAIGLCQMTLYLFLIKEGSVFSRTVLFLTELGYLPISYIAKILYKKHLLRKNAINKGKNSLLIITTTDLAASVINSIKEKIFNDYMISGIVLLDDSSLMGEYIEGIPVIANKKDVFDYVCHNWIDEVLINVPTLYILERDFVNTFVEMGVIVHNKILDKNSTDVGQHSLENFGEYTVLTSSLARITPQQRMLKRFIDICSGICGCIFTLILILVIGPVIFIKSPGPIFFSQVRMGKNGKPFKIYKFRSMYMDAEERKKELMVQNNIKDGMMFKLENDPRIIGSEKGPGKGIGNFIRKYSLDEFPQFFNILKGDMSLIGTRPPTPDEWKKYSLHHRARLAIKPGLTGMWQVSGRSNITDFEEVVRLDKEYITNYSVGLDFRILIKTFGVVLKKDGSM